VQNVQNVQNETLVKILPRSWRAIERSPANREQAITRILQQIQLSLDVTELLPIVIAELVAGLDLTHCQIYLCPIASPIGDANSLVYPIRDSLGELGQLSLQRAGGDDFDAVDRAWIGQIAAQLAIALRCQRLIEANQSQAVELQRLNRVQDDFMGTVSYELRIPLGNIRMAIQMITLALTKESQATSSAETNSELVISDASLSKMLRYLEVLERECDRETKLIQDLLDLQQLDTDTLSMVMSAVNLQEWLPYVVNPYQKRCQEYNLTLEYDIPADLPAFMCDQITLSRIVAELLSNAAKYTPAGGSVTVRMQAIDAASGTKILQIAVCNTGVEIPIEFQAKIFEKFYRLPKLDIRKLGGTGLGLALVDKLVQRLDGQIQLNTHPQETCFVVELPYA
jgi:signal transduction histidine kinase